MNIIKRFLAFLLVCFPSLAATPDTVSQITLRTKAELSAFTVYDWQTNLTAVVKEDGNRDYYFAPGSVAVADGDLVLTATGVAGRWLISATSIAGGGTAASTAPGAMHNLSGVQYVTDNASLAALGTSGPSTIVTLGRAVAGDGQGGEWTRVAAATYTTNSGFIINGTDCQFIRTEALESPDFANLAWWPQSTVLEARAAYDEAVAAGRTDLYLPAGVWFGIFAKSPLVSFTLRGAGWDSTILTNHIAPLSGHTMFYVTTNVTVTLKDLRTTNINVLASINQNTTTNNGAMGLVIRNVRAGINASGDNFIPTFIYSPDGEPKPGNTVTLDIDGLETHSGTNQVHINLKTGFTGAIRNWTATGGREALYNIPSTDNVGWGAIWGNSFFDSVILDRCKFDDFVYVGTANSYMLQVIGDNWVIQNCYFGSLGEYDLSAGSFYSHLRNSTIANNTFKDGKLWFKGGSRLLGTPSITDGAGWGNKVYGNTFDRATNSTASQGSIVLSVTEQTIGPNNVFVWSNYPTIEFPSGDSQHADCVIVGNTFDGARSSGSSAATAIYVEGGSTNVQIINNTFVGSAGNTAGLNRFGIITFEGEFTGDTHFNTVIDGNMFVSNTYYAIAFDTSPSQIIQNMRWSNNRLVSTARGLSFGGSAITLNGFQHFNNYYDVADFAAVAATTVTRNTSYPFVAYNNYSERITANNPMPDWLKGESVGVENMVLLSTNLVASLDLDAEIIGANTNTFETTSWVESGNGWDDTAVGGVYQYTGTNAVRTATLTATLDTSTIRAGRRYLVTVTATGAASGLNSTNTLTLTLGGTVVGTWTNGQSTLTLTSARTAGSTATLVLTASSSTNSTMAINLTSFSLKPWATADVLAEINVPIGGLKTTAFSDSLRLRTWGTNVTAAPIGWYFVGDAVLVPSAIATLSVDGPWMADVMITRGTADTRWQLTGTVWDSTGVHPIQSTQSAIVSTFDFDVNQAYVLFTGASATAAGDVKLYGFNSKLGK